MTERERWIVYPLLFLALGAALRDKLFDRTTSKSIVCQELTVVDAEPVGNRQVRVLAKIGRTEPNVGAPSSGYLIVNGQLDVQGVVNAQQYRYQGVPFVPAFQGLPLGISWPDLLRAMQQAAESRQPQNAPPQPPETQATQPQPAETRSSQPSDPSPPAKPLAEPAELR
jgi:hypothetical protein